MPQDSVDLRRAWPHLGLIPKHGGGWGTGFLVLEDKVLTARHNVGSSRTVTFRMNDGDFEAEVKCSYTDIDLAVLQLKPREGQPLPALPPVRLTSVTLPVQFVSWGYGVPTAESHRLLLGDGTVRAYAHPLYQLQYNHDVLLPGMSGGPVAVENRATDSSSPDDGSLGIHVFAIIEGAYTSRSPDPQFRIGFATAVDAFPADLLRELGGNPQPIEIRFEQDQRRRIRFRHTAAMSFLGGAALAMLAAIPGFIGPTLAIAIVTSCLAVATGLHLSAREAEATLRLTRPSLRRSTVV